MKPLGAGLCQCHFRVPTPKFENYSHAQLWSLQGSSRVSEPQTRKPAGEVQRGAKGRGGGRRGHLTWSHTTTSNTSSPRNST